MTWILIIQWVLLIWLVSLFIRSVLEIFNMDRLDNVASGVLFILAGIAWIVSLRWKININQIFYPFFIQSSIGLLLASYGVKMIWKKPVGSVIVCVVIALVSGFLYYNAPKFSENKSSFISRYFPFLNSEIGINQSSESDEEEGNNLSAPFGTKTDEKLHLTSNIGNLTFSSKAFEELFTVDPNVKVDKLNEDEYKINNYEDEHVVFLRDTLEELKISKKVGNVTGVLDGTYGSVTINADAGNVRVDLKGSCEIFSGTLNMGNFDMKVYSAIPSLLLKVDVGNITLHVAKGIRIETDSIKAKIGQIRIEKNGDGSMGTIQLKAETNIGNITIIADL